MNHHYLRGNLLLNQNRFELEPDCAANRGLLSHVVCETKRFDEALCCAEEGLAIDAADDLCLTYRARALMGLGRTPEAGVVADKFLAEGPEDAWNHCVKGEQFLEQSRGHARRHVCRKHPQLARKPPAPSRPGTVKKVSAAGVGS